MMRSLFTGIVLILLMTQITTAIVIDIDDDFEETTVNLGRSILVEERTAIWCPTCAEIDPELTSVANSHGSRVAIVALHTSDSFENDASRERMEYQNLSDSGQYGTPTFFVDHLKTAEGYDAWQDVQKRILTQENSRITPVPMEFTISEGDIIAPIPLMGQLTIMLLEHEKMVPEDEENEGEESRDRVLIAMRVIQSGGNITDYGNLSKFPESWSVVIVHEPTEGGEPYGVVEVAYRDVAELEDNQLFWILLGGLVLGGLVVFLPNRERPKAEE